MADSRLGAAELRGEPGARCSVGQEVLKKKKKKRQVGDMSRGRRNQPERAPSGRSWDSVSHTVNIIVLARNPSTIK